MTLVSVIMKMPIIYKFILTIIFSINSINATSMSTGIIYIPINVSNEATVLKLPKDKVIFIPIAHTSYYSTEWPYYQVTAEYVGDYGVKTNNEEKPNLNPLTDSGIKVYPKFVIQEDGELGMQITFDVAKCKEEDAAYYLALAFEATRLTIVDLRTSLKHPNFLIKGKEKDSEKWKIFESVLNNHDLKKEFSRDEFFESN